MTEQDSETLFIQHLDWAQEIGRRIAGAKKQCAFDRDEIIAAAAEGLFSAAQRFDPNHKNHAKYPFKRFAYYRVIGTIRDYFRQRDVFRGKKRFNPSFVPFLPEHHPRDDRSEIERLDKEAVEFIRVMIDKYVWGEPQRVLKMVMRGLTQDEIGAIMGISPSRVSQIVKIARKRLKTALRRER